MNIIVCMCEGNAEKAIIDRLLDSNKLRFNKSELLYEQIFGRMTIDKLVQNHLNRDFGDQRIEVVRIIDSKKEKFEPRKTLHRMKIHSVKTYLTCPEVEILIIIAENKYSDYQQYKSKMKPSVYCKQILKMNQIKKYDFIYNYFSNVDLLVSTLIEYKRLHNFDRAELCLADLLQDEI